MLRTTLMLLCCSFALSFSTLQAQVVDNQLAEIQSGLEDEGYTQILATRYDWLDDDETGHHGLKLVAGRTYRIVGVCDQDCTDVDMFLYGDDSTESLLESDELEDDVPVIEFTPSETKVYRVKIGMYDCSIEPCQVGIDVFRAN